ncbi:Protein of unknown function [Cryobacterium psychrotolerans]|uniref:Uncharacterized protein n=1 Tax=Cryobacterium psychrotolerans TaxID=386301 RepID=A0A1G9HN25_9MICO|nr:DUF262 domain-containing protein [Cryobacterium psychrotolerans]TFD85537.1 DUF262 domain-containing protein [Cryobacterium psychrotolerans]SDL14381.1 Protein of unknown function [Cryobacterium psychrotolerans]
MKKKIDAFAYSIRAVLKGNKYSIDYYQREYKWKTKQIAELIADLTARFSQAYDVTHTRESVLAYPHYFLGSIVVSDKEGTRFIVDGQQRLTSLTLLLMYLRRLQAGMPARVNIDELIYSEAWGIESFNLDVAEREPCMRSLYEDASFDPEGASESVEAIWNRFADIEELFPNELRGDALPLFIDWLQHCVQIVQITAYDDDDAYSIFETMNDRGLNLTPSDMLKGYLLANIGEGPARIAAGDLWKSRLAGLADLGKEADADFFKTWFRSQYAKKIRERKRDAIPEDYDKIGTEFHRWLRRDAELVGLTSRAEFGTFVQRDFDFYSKQFIRISIASTSRDPKPDLPYIGFNSDNGFTLQFQLLMAPLRPQDTPTEISTKLMLVSRYVDILLAWRLWNNRSIAYSTMQYAMFLVMRDIRGMGVDELAAHLHGALSKESETFASLDRLKLHQQNRLQLHRILARITDYVGVQSGEPSRYLEMTNQMTTRYEVEHIWADHPERHLGEFEHAYDFAEHRNLIGDLLLLPKSFNASFGDLPYEKKLPHYLSQNLLARSLHPQCYERNPGFVRFVHENGLDFHPYDEFKASSVLERGQLYQAIAQQVWNPDDLPAIAAGLQA